MKTIEFKSDIIAIHWLLNFSNSPQERARMRKDIFTELLAENKGVKWLLKEFSELSSWFLDQGKTDESWHCPVVCSNDYWMGVGGGVNFCSFKILTCKAAVAQILKYCLYRWAVAWKKFSGKLGEDRDDGN